MYCLESVDLPKDRSVFDIALSTQSIFNPEIIKIENSDIMSLTAKADVKNESNWSNQLYREKSTAQPAQVNLRLIPYYAWGNRGHVEMETWIPLDR